MSTQHCYVVLAVLFGLSPFALLAREYVALHQQVDTEIFEARRLSDEGEALERQGNIQHALQNYEKALQLHAGSSLTYLRLANLYYRQNNIPKAAEYARKAIQYDPRSSEGYNKLGVMTAIQGDIAQAVVYFRTAVDLAPQNQNARANLQRALDQLQRRQSR